MKRKAFLPMWDTPSQKWLQVQHLVSAKIVPTIKGSTSFCVGDNFSPRIRSRFRQLSPQIVPNTKNASKALIAPRIRMRPRRRKIVPNTKIVPTKFLGAIDALDRHLGLGLTWYDVAHLYEGHIEARARFYLKSQSSFVKLISCLPKSNKGMTDDFLIVSGPWSDGLPCPTKLGEPGGVT